MSDARELSALEGRVGRLEWDVGDRYTGLGALRERVEQLEATVARLAAALAPPPKPERPATKAPTTAKGNAASTPTATSAVPAASAPTDNKQG